MIVANREEVLKDLCDYKDIWEYFWWALSLNVHRLLLKYSVPLEFFFISTDFLSDQVDRCVEKLPFLYFLFEIGEETFQ